MDGHRPQLLLIGDHQATSHAIRRLLTRRGWEVDEAGTIAEAVDRLDSNRPPDYVLLDLELPDGHAKAVVRKVRTERYPTRVVVDIGTSDPARLAEASYMRPDAVLREPIAVEEVCRVCDRQFS